MKKKDDKNNNKHDIIYENGAELVGKQEIKHCERCHEPLLFAMKDNYHEFSIGLSTIVNCLIIAEEEGFVPKLPLGWKSEAVNFLEE